MVPGAGLRGAATAEQRDLRQRAQRGRNQQHDEVFESQRSYTITALQLRLLHRNHCGN